MAKKESKAEDLIRRHTRSRRQAIGFFLCLLALIGLVSLVLGGVRLTQNILDDSEERKAYEQRLTYLVMLDMLPFESLQQANQADLLESCIWAALFNENSLLYARDESGALLLPSADVDRYAAKLFGPDYKLPHATFESEGMVFNFNDVSLCYTIPVTGQVGNYTPQVVEISGSGSVQRVSVGYLLPYTSATDLASNRDTSKPVKYYDYLFTQAADGNYYLTSMEESAWVAETADSNSSTVLDPLAQQPMDRNVAVGEALNEVDPEIAQELEAAASAAAESAGQPADEEFADAEAEPAEPAPESESSEG